MLKEFSMKILVYVTLHESLQGIFLRTQQKRDCMDRISYASAVRSNMNARLCIRSDVTYALSITNRLLANPSECH